MNISSTNDLLQQNKKLKIPEIRVWCHPHYIDKKGSDYYKVFNSFKEALDFIEKHEESESVPLLAFRGYELNLWTIKFSKNK